jgi:lipoprotein-anchoring transpeptidase ErfK/SrfK
MSPKLRRRGVLAAAVLTTPLVVTTSAGFSAALHGSGSLEVTAGTRGAGSTLSTGKVGPGEPAPGQTLAHPTPGTARHASRKSPCVHNRRAQLVIVSIERQHEWACAYRRTVLSTPVTTGASSRHGDTTPRGTFAVQGLDRNTVLTTRAAGRYRVRYWIPFHLGVWGFHDASWQTMPFGSKHYVTRGSHGCVHMPLAAIRWLFHWVHYATRVRIH